MQLSDTTQEIRERIVRLHTESENQHDLVATVSTFARPRYEVMATDESHDGEMAVHRFLQETLTAFPDFSLETRQLYHTNSAVIVEARFCGHHEGVWRGLPPTGRAVDYPMCNIFVFEETDLVTERLYFDLAGIMRQLGIARDPTSLPGQIGIAMAHPITTGRAYLRRFFHA